MIIKLILLAGLFTFALYAYRGRPTATTLALRRLGGICLAVVAALAVLFPDLTTRAANLVGVGRGTDLVLYSFVLGSLFVWVGLYKRVHALESRIVALSRALAMEGTLVPTNRSDDAGDLAGEK